MRCGRQQQGDVGLCAVAVQAAVVQARIDVGHGRGDGPAGVEGLRVRLGQNGQATAVGALDLRQRRGGGRSRDVPAAREEFADLLRGRQAQGASKVDGTAGELQARARRHRPEPAADAQRVRRQRKGEGVAPLGREAGQPGQVLARQVAEGAAQIVVVQIEVHAGHPFGMVDAAGPAAHRLSHHAVEHAILGGYVGFRPWGGRGREALDLPPEHEPAQEVGGRPEARVQARAPRGRGGGLTPRLRRRGCGRWRRWWTVRR